MTIASAIQALTATVAAPKDAPLTMTTTSFQIALIAFAAMVVGDPPVAVGLLRPAVARHPVGIAHQTASGPTMTTASAIQALIATAAAPEDAPLTMTTTSFQIALIAFAAMV